MQLSTISISEIIKISFNVYSKIIENTGKQFVNANTDKKHIPGALKFIQKNVLNKFINLLKSKYDNTFTLDNLPFSLSNSDIEEIANNHIMEGAENLTNTSLYALILFNSYLQFIKYINPSLPEIIDFISFKSKAKNFREVIDILSDRSVIKFNGKLSNYIELKKNQIIVDVENKEEYEAFVSFKNMFNTLSHLSLKKDDNSLQNLKINFLISLFINRGLINFLWLGNNYKNAIAVKVKIGKDYISKLLNKKIFISYRDKDNQISISLSEVTKKDHYILIPLDNVSYLLFLNILRLNYLLRKKELEFNVKIDEIKSYVDVLYSKYELKSLSFKKFAEYSKLYFYKKLPPLFYSPFLKIFDYTDLHLSFFQRTYNKKNPSISPATKHISSKEPKASKAITNFKESEIREQIKILFNFYSSYKNKFQNGIVGKMDEELIQLDLNTLPSTTKWIIKWFNAKVKYLKFSTVKDYFSGFYKFLLDIAGTDIEAYDFIECEEIIEEIYWSMLINAYENRKDKEGLVSISDYKTFTTTAGKIRAKISSFFDFYFNENFKKYYDKSDEFDTLKNEILSVMPYEKNKAIIRKFTITPKDAFEFEKFLANNKDSINNVERKVFIFRLGFWLGLRRSEIANLKSDNFFFGIENFVKINKSKTESGKRKIIFDYVPDKVKNFIIKHAKNINYTFEDCQKDINEIILLMKHFFKSDEIVFHSLRHSFASWMFLQYFSIQSNGEFNRYLDNLFDEKDFYGLSYCNKDKFEDIFGIKVNNFDNTFMIKLSHVIGHLFYDTTLSNYIHVLGLYLSYYFHKYENLDPRVNTMEIIPEVNSIDTIKRNKALKTENLMSELIEYLKSKPLYCDD